LPSRLPGKRVGDILSAIDRIQSYLNDIGGVDALMQDEYLHRDAVERQLLVLSEAATKLRGQVENLEPGIDWHAIRGIGNFIRHNYDGVEDEIIRRVLASELQPLADACHRLRRSFEG
jgi:uncharacterized protein with HEPN domain